MFGRGAFVLLAVGVVACGDGLTDHLSPRPSEASGGSAGVSSGSDASGVAGTAPGAGGLAGIGGSAGAQGNAGNPETGSASCSPSQPFRTPVLVPGLSGQSGNVISARFSPDELTAYLAMFHGTNQDLYVATRTSRSAPFGDALPLTSLNLSRAVDDALSVTADGLVAIFESDRSNAYELYVSSRSDPSREFAPPVELTDLTSGADGGPFLVADGSAVYFHRYDFRVGHFDIYRAARKPGTSTYGPAESLNINTLDEDESWPVVSPDELTLYFLSTKSAAYPVLEATRQSTSQPWGDPVSFVELAGPNTLGAPLWLSPDGCRLYLQEIDSAGGLLIYVAERLPDTARQ